MVFFRIKKIKGKEYAYMVENRWNSQGSRQKVKGYLGRAYRFTLKNSGSFSEFKKIINLELYINNTGKERIIEDLIEWELFKFGINKQEFIVDLKDAHIQKNKRKAVFLINDGFMCNLTLRNLFEFKPQGDEQVDGHNLARALVETGIKVPEEVFVGLFGKFYKMLD